MTVSRKARLVDPQPSRRCHRTGGRGHARVVHEDAVSPGWRENPLMRTDVFFPLEMRVSVEGSLLDTVWNVPSAAVACAMHLPRAAARAGRALGGPLIGPDLGGAEVAIEDWHRRGMTDDGLLGFDMWGGVTGSKGSGQRASVAYLSRAVAVSTYDGPEDDDVRTAFAAETNEAVHAWFGALVAWLEAISGKVIGEPQVTVEPPHPADRDAVVIDGSGRATHFVEAAHGGRLFINADATLSLDDWTTAAHFVATDAPVPLAHDVLREARRAQRRRDGRRAVIDAASASEVALSESIRQHLEDAPRDAIDRQLRRMSGVAELYDFHVLAVRHVTVVSHGRLASDLAGLRNVVAHAGHRPTTDEVERALAVAEALVREVAPLPKRDVLSD